MFCAWGGNLINLRDQRKEREEKERRERKERREMRDFLLAMFPPIIHLTVKKRAGEKEENELLWLNSLMV
jgi:hypothetical protein